MMQPWNTEVISNTEIMVKVSNYLDTCFFNNSSGHIISGFYIRQWIS
jgi:hypothetical protein